MSDGEIYRRVSVRMHDDEKYRRLSTPAPNAQSLWDYLLHGRETTAVPGIVLVGRSALAEAKKWSLDDMMRCWEEIESLGMAKADWDARFVWLPKAIHHNPPCNPNHATGWAKQFAYFPECPLRDEAIAYFREAMREIDNELSEEAQDGGEKKQPWSRLKAFDKGLGRLLKRLRNRSGTVSEPFRNRSQTVTQTVSKTETETETEIDHTYAREEFLPPEKPGTPAGSDELRLEDGSLEVHGSVHFGPIGGQRDALRELRGLTWPISGEVFNDAVIATKQRARKPCWKYFAGVLATQANQSTGPPRTRDIRFGHAPVSDFSGYVAGDVEI